MKYNEITRRYFESAPCTGVLDGEHCRRGAAGSRQQGTWVQFDLRLDAAGGRIEEARFRAFGCPHVIALAAWLAEQAGGSAVNPALPESVERLGERFGVPVEKRGRLLIVEDAWAAAIESRHRQPHV